MKKKIKELPIQPDDWKTGTVPVTKLQKDELKQLTSTPIDPKLSKAGAANQIDELQKKVKSPQKKK